jgi:hypothetical protein
MTSAPDGSFAELRNSLGYTKRADVTFTDGTRREFPYGDASDMLRELSGLSGVADISLRSASLEEGVASLFEKWRNSG